LRSCKDIGDVITAIEDQGRTVGDAYLIKLVTTTISDITTSEESPYPYSETKEAASHIDHDQSEQIAKEIAGAVEKHPNVFNFRCIDPTFSADMFIDTNATLLDGPIYSADVHLPKKQQKYQDMDCEEHFSVLISGTYFAAYA